MAQISDHSVWKEFGKNDLTHSWAHYLTAIYAIHDEQGFVRLSDVAKRLDITKGALSTSLKPLRKKGWIWEDEKRYLRLSKEAAEKAMRVQKSYSVMRYLLEDFLGIDKEVAQIDACKVEHLMSEESSSQLLKMVKALKGSKELRDKLHEEMGKRHNCDLKCIIAEDEEDICTR